jgi:hypothetical protein
MVVVLSPNSKHVIDPALLEQLIVLPAAVAAAPISTLTELKSAWE